MSKGNMFINRKVMACAISIVISLVGFICLKTLPAGPRSETRPSRSQRR